MAAADPKDQLLFRSSEDLGGAEPERERSAKPWNL